MREQFEIVIDFYDDKEVLQQKTYRVTANYAARAAIDRQLNGPLGFAKKIADNGGVVLISDATVFLTACLTGSGYDVKETDIGEALNDIGEIETTKIIEPLLTAYLGRISGKKKKTQNSASPKKRTRSR